MNPSEIEPEAKGMTRRQFAQKIAITGTAVAGALAGGFALWQREHFLPGFEEKKGISLPSYAPEKSNFFPDLAVAEGSGREYVIRVAIDALGGMSRFVKKNDRVLIKPNVAFDRPAALGATTHPDALRVVTKLCLEAGAKQVVVADNPINSPIGCFLKSGLQKVVNDLELDLVYPETSAFLDIQMDGEILQNWPLFHRPLKNINKVIGLAPCKDHNLCHASMTMKNWYGLLGGRRNQFHQHIHSIVSDFALMIQPTLVILDGFSVLMKNGPTGGRLSDVKQMNTIIAGTDMVAVDSYGFSKLLERDIDLLQYVHKAHNRGLGNMNWKDLKLKKVSS
jgi:uncharacterized protein (DUF362 family)